VASDELGGWSALRLSERSVETFEAGFGPELAGVVVIAERRRLLRQLEPLRFRPGINVHVRLQSTGVIERSDAYEPEIGPAPVIAPERGLTPGAAVDVVRPALARHRHGYRLAAEQLDRLSLNNRVEYERAARYPLAVVAMTAVNEHWLVDEVVADGSAGAAASDFLCHGQRGEQFFSSVRRRIPTSGDASTAIRARPLGPSRPDDGQCRDS
jgi:hypothetical protein